MIRRTNILKGYTTATEVKSIDLPVNPISHIILSMDGYNVTDEATLAEIIASINKIEVLHEGRSIVSQESEDLYALNCYLFGKQPMLTQNIATDNAFRQLNLIIPFGRKLFNPAECMPATQKGELTLKLDVTAPSAALDNSTLQIDVIELIGATPAKTLKSTVRNIVAPGATGEKDISLPIGNDYVALLAWLTTFPATSSHLYGVNGWKLKKDNIEHVLAYHTTQGLIGEMATRLPTMPRDIAAFGQVQPAHYVWIDFCPNGDDENLIKTEGAADMSLVADYGVNEAMRLTVVELQQVSGG
jgi:hypothetical protein